MDASAGGPRHAPPALVVAVAVGLASMDMPIPHVDSWDWANWKFPRQVKAGDTVYARWTLTQKRAPGRGARTSVAVWRVDVHTADGTICAEGEVGASVFRTAAAAPAAQEAGPAAAAAAAPPAPRRRRRKRSSTGEAPAAPPPPAPAAQPSPTAQERSGGGRRRRRRRTSGGGGNGNHVTAPPAAAALPAPYEAVVAASPAAARANANPLTRVMKRLRGASS